MITEENLKKDLLQMSDEFIFESSYFEHIHHIQRGTYDCDWLLVKENKVFLVNFSTYYENDDQNQPYFKYDGSLLKQITNKNKKEFDLVHDFDLVKAKIRREKIKELNLNT